MSDDVRQEKKVKREQSIQEIETEWCREEKGDKSKGEQERMSQ